METARSKIPLEGAAIFIYSVLLLFFLQLLSDFVESIYTFGLLGTRIPVEIVSVLLFFSPVVLLVLPRELPESLLLILGEAALACRLVAGLLDTRGKMLVSGLGVGCFLVFFPLLLAGLGRRKAEGAGARLGGGLLVALGLSIFFRSANSGVDLSTQGGFQVIAWILGLAAGALLYHNYRQPCEPEAAENPAKPAGLFNIAALSIGIVAAWVLLYFAFASPNVIARWTGDSYLLVVGLLATGLALYTLLLAGRMAWFERLPLYGLLAWNLLFVLALFLAIRLNQFGFPQSEGAYPLFAPPVSAWQYLALALALLLSPVILLDFSLFCEALVAMRPATKTLGAGFSLAALFLLLMVFAQVFTSVYDYIPLLGPPLRDRFWLVYLLAGLALALPVLFVRAETLKTTLRVGELSEMKALPGVAIVLGLASIAAVLTTASRPAAAVNSTALRVLTFNIQQGYSADGQKNIRGQLELIRSLDADVVGLQETDTNRISGGNSDIVRYFADRLDLYSYYGPKTVLGTFGIALLSKYPIQNPHTFYMYSPAEQTATIEAQITAGNRTFNIFVTHLGNGGPLVQQEAVLKEGMGKPNLILMGDFNFRPNSEQYQLTTQVLEDAWLVKWPQGIDRIGRNKSAEIDHIFVTPGMDVIEARYLTGPDSDHPALAIDIRP